MQSRSRLPYNCSMSEDPAKSTRRQFTLATIFVVVSEACMCLAAMRLLSGDERIGLLVVMAILAIGYGVFRLAWRLIRILKSFD
jgi:hypothetical protein